MKSKNLLNDLPNEQLSSVEFIQDYLQLHFDDKTLTCYIWPVLKCAGNEYTQEDRDYKNQLCNLIAQKVKQTIFNEKENLVIIFSNNSQVVLSLNEDNPEIVGQIAILSDQNNNWSIF